MASTTARIGDIELSIDQLTLQLKGSESVYFNCMVAQNASGYAVNVTAATGLTIMGVAAANATNPGADGAANCVILTSHGTRAYLMKNAASAIAVTDVGKTCYAVDNESVNLTSSGQSVAGVIVRVTSAGVYVRFAY